MTETEVDPAPEIRVEHVGLTYETRNGALDALAGCSLAVPGGTFACLVGPSGCGKSTLLDVVAGLASATSGTIRIAPHADGTKARIAVVFQRPALFPWKTVLGNVSFGLEAQGLARREARRWAKGFVERVGLAGFTQAMPHELSGGTAQRVGIARALALEPDLLLMDEPFAAVDAQTRVLLQKELRAITGRSAMTVLFVTHDVPEAVYLGDLVFVMSARPGRIIRTIEVDTHDRASGDFARTTANIFDLLGLPASSAEGSRT